MLRLAFITAFLLGTLPALAASTIEVQDAWVRPPIGNGAVAAAYATLADKSGDGDTLTGIDVPSGGTATLHETTNDNGIMRMRPKPTLSVPSGGTVAMKPGAVHIMLMDVPKGLKAGDTLALRLHFARSGEMTVNFSVRP